MLGSTEFEMQCGGDALSFCNMITAISSSMGQQQTTGLVLHLVRAVIMKALRTPGLCQERELISYIKASADGSATHVHKSVAAGK